MFQCDICNEIFDDEEMSEENNICKTCLDERDIEDLLILDII